MGSCFDSYSNPLPLTLQQIAAVAEARESFPSPLLSDPPRPPPLPSLSDRHCQAAAGSRTRAAVGRLGTAAAAATASVERHGSMDAQAAKLVAALAALKEVQEDKERGNAAYRKGRLHEARAAYTEALEKVRAAQAAAVPNELWGGTWSRCTTTGEG